MTGNYDHVAPFYDSLANLVFGKAIVNANLFLARAIPANSTILVVGGGTGIILEQISKIHRQGLEVTYVEISKKMLDIAKTRDTGFNKITFINQPIQEVQLTQIFTVIITPFLLDNFKETNLQKVFSKLDKLLCSGGSWLFADFQIDDHHSFWQKPLLKLMYLFFKILCNVEASTLPDTKNLFLKYNYKLLSYSCFYKNFICSIVYRKQRV